MAVHCNLLFHWDLAVLVGLKRNADVPWFENTHGSLLPCAIIPHCAKHDDMIQYCVRTHHPQSEATDDIGVHLHFLQEDLSARIVSCGVVSNRKNVVCPVLMQIQSQKETAM